MFAQRFVFSLRKGKKNRAQTVDIVAEQVKKMLQETNQQLILMVRG